MTEPWDGWDDERPAPGDGDVSGSLGDGPLTPQPPDPYAAEEYPDDETAAEASAYEPEPDADPTVGDEEAYGQGWSGGGEAPEPLGYADEPAGTPDADPPTADTGLSPDQPPAVVAEGGEFVGADPDPDPMDTDTDPTAVFPEPVELVSLPEPVDGPPWADATLLGDPDTAALPDPAVEAAAGSPEPADLYGYAGQDLPDGGASWADLRGSPDPAVNTLARFWSTPT